MNIVRFNDPFFDAIRSFPKSGMMHRFGPSSRSSGIAPMPFPAPAQTIGKGSERNVVSGVRGWWNTPLFQHNTTRSREKQALKQMLESGMRLETCPWPFETFRLALTQYCDEHWETDGIVHGAGYYRANFVVTRQGERVFFLGNVIRLYDETPETMASARRYTPLIVYMHDAYTSLDNSQEYGYQQATYAAGRWLAATQPIATDITQGLMDSLAAFIVESMAPTNHIAQVRPDEPTRSVEWLRARTHYTLITHGHPANKREVREGEKVTVDYRDEIRRMCHDRKGHFKTLRHPRFKYALNEKRYPDMPKGTIYVKPCWVGPKEWRDQGGKQIYKILEPLTEESKAA